MTNLPDSGAYDYSVVFQLDGLDRRFEYLVSKETSERIREALEDDDAGNVIFEAFRPAEQIVINARFIQVAQFRWRPAAETEYEAEAAGDGDPAGGDSLEERANAVSFYFAGRETPVVLFVDDPEEAFDAILAMETEAFSRCSIVDAEGEEAVLDLRKLACAEFPLGLADRGGAAALFELEEEA